MVHIDLLRRIPMLENLPDAELGALGSAMTRRVIDRGDHVINFGDTDRTLYFLAEGRLKVCVSNEQGKELILGLLNPGAFLGELALLTGEPRTADVVANVESVVFVMTLDAFEDHATRYNGFMRVLLEALAHRVIKTSRRIGDIALCDVYHRIYNVLKSIAVPSKDAPCLTVERRPTHQELASMAGTSREMVTRVLKALEEDKMIETEGRTVRIIDRVESSGEITVSE